MGCSLVFSQWLKTRRPVLFELDKQLGESPWIANFNRYGLKNMAAHGQCDLVSKTGSYFSLCRIPGSLNSSHASLLEMLVPHMHAALIRAFKDGNKLANISNSYSFGLTARELEVLKWVSTGKTNWEIAQVMLISEHTIKNHVHRILGKLKVINRVEAAAKVLGQN